ncbi:Cathepsin F [Trichostrongylus colubriformis]|uniref:Cathepsin F n=1 Tax=Trichostrongylus colubriformis TaxID=6319 RepID=A0AAN8F866_TRICO
MWPKFDPKSTNINFEPLQNDYEELSRKRSSNVIQRLANCAAIFIQCLLLIFILICFNGIAFNLYRKSEWAQGQSLLDRLEGEEDRFNKSYASDEERVFRFSVFVKNVEDFEEEESKHPGLDLDVTQFADWTEEEMIRYLSGNHREIRVDGPRFEGTSLQGNVKRPAEIDWAKAGKLTPVKDQGKCGSCWAFATVASIEAVNAIKTGNVTRLSEQEMVDCDTQNNGCQGGYRPYAMRFAQQNGLMKEDQYPYKGSDHNTCLLNRESERVFIQSYRMLSTNEEVIADWVATNGPVTFGMNVTKSMYSYRSGIFSPSQFDCEQHSLGSHALIFVGYGTENGQPYWLVKNSWGTWWGQNGFFKLARGQNTCGAANTVVGPIMGK